MKKKNKSNQPSAEEQKRVYSGDLKYIASGDWSGPESDHPGDLKIILNVGLSQFQMQEIARLKDLGNSGIHLILFMSEIEPASAEDSQKVPFNPVEQKVKIDYGLTKCESEVMEKLDKGHTYQEISDIRFRSIHTIKRQASDIYGKYGVHKCQQASAKFREFVKIIIPWYLKFELLTEIPWLFFN
jgi:DNA-binding CsgD family transcriptional regulator